MEKENKPFFHIPFACDLMQKSPTQVLVECSAFNARLLTDDELYDYRVDKHYGPFDATVQFLCDFMLRDYQAFSSVGICFIGNKAVECIISLGRPANLKQYGSEREVTRLFLVTLEELYLNGRIHGEDEAGTRAYTWKKDDRMAVSFISYHPSEHSTDTGVRLSVQIRDTQLHPQGGDFELLYNMAEDSVQDLGKEFGDKKNSHTQGTGAAPVETVDISPQLKSFCSDYITALGEALDTAIRVDHKEYEAGFNDAMDILSSGRWDIPDRNPFQFKVPRKDRPEMLSEIEQLAEITGIPYNKLSPLNQFIVTIPPYIFYCLEKYIPEPELKEEASRLIATRGFPRYLQKDLGGPISQKIGGAFWKPNALGCLARLFGFGRRH